VLREVADIPHQRRGVGLVAQQRTELQATHDVMGEGAVGPSALITAEPLLPCRQRACHSPREASSCTYDARLEDARTGASADGTAQL